MDPFQFFCLLYGHFGENFGGFVTLVAGFGPGRLGGHSHFPLAALAAAAECATSFSEGRRDAYFGLGLTRPGVASGRRGHETDVVGLPGLWLDLDVGKPAPGPGGLPSPPDLASALEVLCQLPPDRQPTLLVQSGGGLHAYWLFDRPLVLSDEGSRWRARRASDALQQAVRSIAQRRGWSVDHTSDLTRVLRVPGTLNYKRSDPRPVSVLDYRGRLFAPDFWLDYAPPSEARVLMVPPSPRVTAQPRKALQPGQDVLAYVVECMRSNCPEDARPLVAALLAGEPLSGGGGRDNAAQRLTAMASWYALEVKPQVTSEDLYPLFAASVAAMQGQAAANAFFGPPPDEVEVRRKIDANVADSWPKRHAEWVREDAVSDGLVVAQMRMEAPRSFRERVASRSLDDLRRGYTDEDVAFFAAQQGTTADGWPARWVVQKGASFWVYLNGQYRGPFQQVELEGIMRSYLAAAKINFYRGSKLRKLPDLLREYCTNALSTKGSLHRQYSVFDSATGCFHEALCPVVPGLDPSYSEEVDRWLRVLGGDQREKLLDWIATVTRLDLPSCALYLFGPKGAGKGMLAEGLALLWGEQPTPIEAVFGSFNELMVKCPLIFADEKLQVNAYDQQGVSGKLRRIVATSSHHLNRKHVSMTHVEGCVRLLLASNNENMLEDAKETNLTREDVEAIAERFLFVRVPARASELLASLGGRRYTRDWVAGGQIARHALWLRDNRRVEFGSRFAVQGELSTAVRSLVVGYGLGSAVSEWICAYLTAPERIASIVGGDVYCGGGKLILSTSAVAQHWRQYVAHGQVPSTTAIGRALHNMSHSRVKRAQGNRRFRCHDINLEYVLAWAKRHSVASIEDLRARVAQGAVPQLEVESEADDAPPAVNVVPAPAPAYDQPRA